MEAQTRDPVGQQEMRAVENTGKGKTCAEAAHLAPCHAGPRQQP